MSLKIRGNSKGDSNLMKILVLSDSHGNISNMITAVHESEPDMVIHLGDCESDLFKLEECFPDMLFENIAGNCDYEEELLEKIIEVEGRKILICHGHTYNVKAGYLNLQMAALEKKVDITLFGHTHKVFYDHHNGLAIMNPGSIGAPPYGIPPSYGIIWLDDEGIELDVRYIE